MILPFPLKALRLMSLCYKQNLVFQLRAVRPSIAGYDNEIHYFDIEYRKIFAKKGEYIGFFLNLIDTTEKRLAYEKEKYLATHDTLTGLYNKDYFQ